MPANGTPAADPHLALYLFGAPRIERGGHLIALDTRKALAVLAYLATTGQAQSRDTLVGLLWPEYDEPHARATLRRTLSALNKALAGEGMRVTRGAIAPNLETLWVDVRAFADHLARCATHGHRLADVCPACIGPLESAVALYTHDFLAGFSLRDSPEFDDWQMVQAQTLRRDLASALERLARGLSAMRQYERAIGYARRWLALDRLHEAAHRLLMCLYAWSGQRAAALRQYRDCVQALERELGVAPLAETTHLYEAIQENRLPEEPERWEGDVAVAAHPASVTAREHQSPGQAGEPEEASQPALAGHEYPLVGRDDEWRALAGAYAEVGSDDTGGRVVLLEGEAGIGKTRLAADFVEWARSRGAEAIVTRCYEGETDLTYGPIIAGLRAALAQRGDTWLRALPAYWVSEVTRLLPELAGRMPGEQMPLPLETPGARSRFLEGVCQALLAACAGARPGILLIDDAHWADTTSLELIIYLVRRLQSQPVCVLLTGRTESLPPVHPLRRAVAEQQRAGRGVTLVLRRLDLGAIASLVHAVASLQGSGTEPAVMVERLRAETEGVPLLVVEYLLGLAHGTVDAADSTWVLDGGVRALLEARLGAVSEAGRQVLSAAAVIGRSFDFDVLHAASGRSEDETVTALEELARQGLVQEVQPSQPVGALGYDFTHEKLRALAYEETSLARRRLLHRRVADVLAARGRSRAELESQPELVAHHYLQAGETTSAAEYFRLAGERARTLFAHAEAVRHLSTALALGHPDAAALHAEIGDLQTMLGEYAKAIASYETAAALADPEALASTEHRLGRVYARRGDWEVAESHLSAALETLPDDALVERARVLADWSLTAHQRGHPEQAYELAGQALELAEGAQDAGAQAQAYNMLGMLASRAGDLRGARSHLERSLMLAERLGDPGARLAALNNLALALGAAGERTPAIERAEAALALSVAQGDRHREAALHNNLADLLHAAGRENEALAHIRQAVVIYAEIGVEAGTVQPAIWRLAEW